ncbi:hypothetical protein FE633_33120 [Streptomyces montanus]|uniref:Uncharacterized protein n=1 Tax=Streptomyces montanus TaxID=2580423 RepID=A0A5R9FE25_9ACTN|nr:hypothetical protein FE633_33120 [Streptomyces montanus]
MEICIAVADWARGPMTSVLGVPGGEGTGARRRRPRHGRQRVSSSGAIGSMGSTGSIRSMPPGPGAGMVAGWG